MQYRYLGNTDFQVSVIGLGTATFGGSEPIFKAWGEIDIHQATRMVDLALEAGVTLFDTADVYSKGFAEEILGKAIKGRRDKLLIATKVGYRINEEKEDVGASRKYLIKACDASLKRLGIDTIDLFQLHGFDMLTDLGETLEALDILVRTGKVRYVGCSNYSGWHLMKASLMAGIKGLPKYVAHQFYYSLLAREAEWELIPAGNDQKIGTIVWSPLSSGMLSGKIGRNQPIPKGSRISLLGARPCALAKEQFFDLIETLQKIAICYQRPVSQIALNWLLQRPTVSSVLLGARNEEQLLENVHASDFTLSPEHIAELDKGSQIDAAYPYWHQQTVYLERNPSLF